MAMTDKECRLCGSAEPGNIDIFSNSINSRGLATKINTVFPIVLYERDPLPKSICQRCLDNLNRMYHEIEQVLKVNTKRVRQVRESQPHSEYSKVLDIIKHSKRSIRKTIRSSLGAHICEHAINRKLIGINAETSSKKRKKLKRKSAGSPPPNEADKVRREPPPQEAKICDLKSQLEMNGCSLLQVPPKKAKKGSRGTEDPSNLAASSSNLASNREAASSNFASKREAASSNLASNMAATSSNLSSNQAGTSSNRSSNHPSNLAAASSSHSSNPAARSSNLTSNLPAASSNISSNLSAASSTLPALSNPPAPSNLSSSSNQPAATIKCAYCPLSFASLAALAQHQVQHMQLTVRRLSEKRLLSEDLRRGRMINGTNGRKCIRCLNCWRIFGCDEHILRHWAQRECEYFCRVCGKEYPLTPKMLREHVPAAHGIRYRAMRFPAPRRKTSHRKSSPSQVAAAPEKVNGHANGYATGKEATAVAAAVTCHLCRHSFKSIWARNSHMRIHKASEPDARRSLATVAAKLPLRIDCVIGPATVKKIKKEPLPSDG